MDVDTSVVIAGGEDTRGLNGNGKNAIKNKKNKTVLYNTMKSDALPLFLLDKLLRTINKQVL